MLFWGLCLAQVDALLTIETWTTADRFLATVLARFVGPEPGSPEWAEFEKGAKQQQGAVVR